MKFTYNSRKLGSTFTFTMLDDGGYIRVSISGGDYKQICYGGGFMGDTISAMPENFERECKRWVKQYIASKPAKYRYDASTDSVYEYYGDCYMFVGRLSGRTLKQFDFDLNFNYN